MFNLMAIKFPMAIKFQWQQCSNGNNVPMAIKVPIVRKVLMATKVPMATKF